jgi:hypothetical protein
MSNENVGALQRLQNEWPYLIEFLEALKSSGGEPKLVYLEMRGSVVRGAKPREFDEPLGRSSPWFPSKVDL